MQTVTKIKEFFNWILHIGDGDMNLNKLGQATIEILEDILILHIQQPFCNWLNLFIQATCKILPLMNFLTMVQ